MNAEWDDLKTILAVARGGTLAAAAEALGLNYTTVARRIQRAEVALGVTLFHRLPEGYQPTETGQLVAAKAAEMDHRADDLFRSVQGQDQTLRGRLVLTAPQLLIGPHIAPVLAQFSDAYPEVEVLLRATNDLLDLNRREADMAIRISRTPGDTLMGLRLCEQQVASFASLSVAKSLADTPQHPIDWIVYEQTPGVPKPALERYPNSRVRLVFDDMVAMIGAAKAGLGVVRMPMFLGRATEGLVQVPILPPQSYADIWVVAHRDVWPSAKVKAFRDLLVPWFKAHKDCFVA
ncbi:HTH-type transcriptional regulator CysL [Falsiruegeria litorea R37]|uniref:HTH-type transcriptional regulator CysL n=1 Tax=Falsiruegeria litorea R37 TaxID=1200284 RepID=A0A1Y5TB89_9RHOB|nr:LysR family transcriptional regulator [Falsiruegeria litorea]SLN60101.1 HTH-type transcriptional regulator CysL [Falsiruegeria litorea R37]